MPTNFGLPPVCCSQWHKKNGYLDQLKRSRWYIYIYTPLLCISLRLTIKGSETAVNYEHWNHHFDYKKQDLRRHGHHVHDADWLIVSMAAGEGVTDATAWCWCFSRPNATAHRSEVLKQCGVDSNIHPPRVTFNCITSVNVFCRWPRKAVVTTTTRLQFDGTTTIRRPTLQS